MNYVPLPDCFRGWEVTISQTLQELTQILEDSLSLRNYLVEVMDECYQKALKNTQIEYNTEFPNISPFPQDVDILLTEKFW